MLYLFLLAKVYLDYAATTFCDPAVIHFMNHLYSKKLGNPHAQHPSGREAQLEIVKAEETLKKCVNGDYVVWTSGATEANNVALLCPRGTGITITCVTEHSSVLAPAKQLKDVVFLPVDAHGRIDMAQLKKHIKKGIRLVSLMAVNNETGVMHPLQEIGDLCHENGVLFHVDGAAAFGKMPLDMKKMHIDMLTLAGHKIYGPQGIGALIISQKGLEAMRNKPLLFGGMPQHGIRPGTPPTVLCAGFGKAAEIAYQSMDKDYKRARTLKDMLWKAIQHKHPQAVQNGTDDWPYILNVRLPKNNEGGKTNLPLQLAKHITFSAGSACSAGKPSHVMTAMGVDTKANHTFRFSLGRPTTKKEIKQAMAAIYKTH